MKLIYILLFSKKIIFCVKLVLVNIGKKMKYRPYSYSKINTYTSCPKKFDFKYIQKIKVKTEMKHLNKGKFYTPFT